MGQAAQRKRLRNRLSCSILCQTRREWKKYYKVSPALPKSRGRFAREEYKEEKEEGIFWSSAWLTILQ